MPDNNTSIESFVRHLLGMCAESRDSFGQRGLEFERRVFADYLRTLEQEFGVTHTESKEK